MGWKTRSRFSVHSVFFSCLSDCIRMCFGGNKRPGAGRDEKEATTNHHHQVAYIIYNIHTYLHTCILKALSFCVCVRVHVTPLINCVFVICESMTGCTFCCPRLAHSILVVLYIHTYIQYILTYSQPASASRFSAFFFPFLFLFLKKDICTCTRIFSKIG